MSTGKERAFAPPSKGTMVGEFPELLEFGEVSDSFMRYAWYMKSADSPIDSSLPPNLKIREAMRLGWLTEPAERTKERILSEEYTSDEMEVLQFFSEVDSDMRRQARNALKTTFDFQISYLNNPPQLPVSGEFYEDDDEGPISKGKLMVADYHSAAKDYASTSMKIREDLPKLMAAIEHGFGIRVAKQEKMLRKGTPLANHAERTRRDPGI